jgi:hypothetical protein
MEVTEHGVHAGTARAIAVVSTMSGVDYRQWELVFPEGERRGTSLTSWLTITASLSMPSSPM